MCQRLAAANNMLHWYTQLLDTDSFTGQDPFGSYTVADVCICTQPRQ